MRKFLLLGTIFVATGAFAFGGIGIGSWQKHKNQGVDAIGIHIDSNGKKADIDIVDGDDCPAHSSKNEARGFCLCESGYIMMEGVCKPTQIDCPEPSDNDSVVSLCCNDGESIMCAEYESGGNCLHVMCVPEGKEPYCANRESDGVCTYYARCESSALKRIPYEKYETVSCNPYQPNATPYCSYRYESGVCHNVSRIDCAEGQLAYCTGVKAPWGGCEAACCSGKVTPATNATDSDICIED